MLLRCGYLSGSCDNSGTEKLILFSFVFVVFLFYLFCFSTSHLLVFGVTAYYFSNYSMVFLHISACEMQ